MLIDTKLIIKSIASSFHFKKFNLDSSTYLKLVGMI